MHTGLMQTVIDVVFPPHCLCCAGAVNESGGLCPDCFRDTSFVTGLVCDGCGTPLPGDDTDLVHCDDCLRIARPWDQGRAALVYAGTGRSLALSLKHRDKQEIAPSAGLWMARAAQTMQCPDPLLVPIPLHLHRLLSRRFNQSALLAQHTATHLSAETCLNALRRRTKTPKLDGMTRDQRFAAMAGKLQATPSQTTKIVDRNVILIDDVMTSGATLAAGTEALRAAGAASVCILVLARVVKDP